LSGVHFPPLQLPPQHSALPVQVPLSEVHARNSHTPPEQDPEQQSTGKVQAAPTWRHIPAPVDPTVVNPAIVLVPVEPVASEPPMPPVVASEPVLAVPPWPELEVPLVVFLSEEHA
jgi:hypothetical protein